MQAALRGQYRRTVIHGASDILGALIDAGIDYLPGIDLKRTAYLQLARTANLHIADRLGKFIEQKRIGFYRIAKGYITDRIFNSVRLIFKLIGVENKCRRAVFPCDFQK